MSVVVQKKISSMSPFENILEVNQTVQQIHTERSTNKTSESIICQSCQRYSSLKALQSHQNQSQSRNNLQSNESSSSSNFQTTQRLHYNQGAYAPAAGSLLKASSSSSRAPANFDSTIPQGNPYVSASAPAWEVDSLFHF